MGHVISRPGHGKQTVACADKNFEPPVSMGSGKHTAPSALCDVAAQSSCWWQPPRPPAPRFCSPCVSFRISSGSPVLFASCVSSSSPSSCAVSPRSRRPLARRLPQVPRACSAEHLESLASRLCRGSLRLAARRAPLPPEGLRLPKPPAVPCPAAGLLGKQIQAFPPLHQHDSRAASRTLVV